MNAENQDHRVKPNRKLTGALAMLVWLLGVLAVFYVVQKPDFLQVASGLGYLLLTVGIPLIMALLSACLGGLLLPHAEALERLTLGTALGLTSLGLTGFFFAALGWANTVTFSVIATALLALLTRLRKIRQFWLDLKTFISELAYSRVGIATWIPTMAGIGLALSLLMGLAPPIEDFDALFYHLTVPSLWLQDGGLSPVAIPHYWYPQLVEGLYVWPLVFGVDTATHIIHLLWLMLTVLLAWHWTRQLWKNAVVWHAILLLFTMPSLLWLAAWAYTDYALTFATLATAYALWKWKTGHSQKWLFIGGLMAGLAVSVKYTGFVVPVTGVLLLLWWEKGLTQKIITAFQFGIICTLLASPWYIRNWVWTGNPLYPFIFGGRFWDSFLAQTYSASGTGIGLDLIKLLSLPFTATLGIYDANYFDGRIGPFFLILLPMILWTFWKSRLSPDGQRLALQTIGGLGGLGIAFWFVGVISSTHLFQTRLLFPVLIPFTIPAALGIEMLQQWDLPRLKISFVFRFMLILVVAVNLLDFGLQVTARNPFAVILGMTPRESYLAKRQPGYAAALKLVNDAPANARIYALFEPRTYGMTVDIQPDPINANFAHDAWLYHTPENIVDAWKQAGYTHVLLSIPGAEFMFQTESDNKLILDQVEALLIQIEKSQDGSYILYAIP